MTRRTVEQETADFLERNRRMKAFSALMNKAHLMPDTLRDPAYVAKRAGVTVARVKKIMSEYDNAPHVHPAATWHDLFGGRGCKLGGKHPGCCPRARGCDMAGVVGRYPEASA